MEKFEKVKIAFPFNHGIRLYYGLKIHERFALVTKLHGGGKYAVLIEELTPFPGKDMYIVPFGKWFNLGHTNRYIDLELLAHKLFNMNVVDFFTEHTDTIGFEEIYFRLVEKLSEESLKGAL